MGYTVRDVLKTLRSHAFYTGNEKLLQDAIGQILDAPFEREYQLGPGERIDFYLPGPKLGIEVKVDGSATVVMRQLQRYLGYSKVQEIILLTTRSKHLGVERVLCGKKVHVIFTGAAF